MDVPERPKRQKRDPFGKMKAFEKLKLVKSGGGKNKYEVDAIDNVYEEVTEEEYTEAVLKRQHDDWIVGDCKVSLALIPRLFFSTSISITFQMEPKGMLKMVVKSLTMIWMKRVFKKVEKVRNEIIVVFRKISKLRKAIYKKCSPTCLLKREKL